MRLLGTMTILWGSHRVGYVDVCVWTLDISFWMWGLWTFVGPFVLFFSAFTCWHIKDSGGDREYCYIAPLTAYYMLLHDRLSHMASRTACALTEQEAVVRNVNTHTRSSVR